jgi:hypothetical protein
VLILSDTNSTGKLSDCSTTCEKKCNTNLTLLLFGLTNKSDFFVDRHLKPFRRFINLS